MPSRIMSCWPRFPCPGHRVAGMPEGRKDWQQACTLLTHCVCFWLPARSKSLVMGEQSRSPGRLPCPRRLGPVLKEGWLKKQRSIMKNWQQRWFVLRGDQLFYYKDKDETKPQVRSTHLVSRGVMAGSKGGLTMPRRGEKAERSSCLHLSSSSPQAIEFTHGGIHQDFRSDFYSQPLPFRAPELVLTNQIHSSSHEHGSV